MNKSILIKFIILLIISVSVGILGKGIDLNLNQMIAVSIFSASVMGTILFWDFRLAVAFLGIGILLATKTIDIENLVMFSSLEVILFLVGMMIIVGLLKDVGFFAWLITLILRIRNLTATKFVLAISIMSALSACVLDEVTSIIFMTAAVLEICNYFEVKPIPFIIISVLATNIGSTGTVLGNPIGILIATKSGLTFEDFIKIAFPLMSLSLAAMICLVIFIYRTQIREFNKKIKELGGNEIFIRLISIPPESEVKIGVWVFGITLGFIALHHRLEIIWNLQANTVLLIVPLISSGIVMIWKWRKARLFIEKDVEWWTLIFFLLLFAKTGTLKFTGVTDIIAKNLSHLAGQSRFILTSIILWTSAIGSSVLDNVVLVAAFIPIIHSFQDIGINTRPLWWALLFGGCFGGNITMIGSTANIVAIGILEKEKKLKIGFFQWLWVGLIIGIITTAIVWLALIILYR